MSLFETLFHHPAPPPPPPPPDDLVRWTDDFSVGNALLDNEHRDIVAVLNALFRHHQGGGQPPDCRRLLKRLADTMRVHCANEEAVMARHRYPELTRHQEEHGAILAELAELEQTLPGQDQAAAEAALARAVRNIVLHHILITDVAARDYLRE